MENNPLSRIEPNKVWNFFYQICRIPRCSKNEFAAAEWIISFAEDRNLEWKRDRAGNVVIKCGASPGMETRSPAVLQSHLDMVCEKNERTEHDFLSDPISPVIQGDWLTADGTTLGADNGIGVAMTLALLDSEDIPHGPLEALFTVDEETGLTGALNLDPSLLSSKHLLNLDTEEYGVFYIGCAGGVTCEGEIPVTIVNTSEPAGNSGYSALEMKIIGFRGGHSGLDIHLGLGNALSAAGRILMNLSRETDLLLISVDGGNKHNAIPRECTVRFSFLQNDSDKVRKTVLRVAENIKVELGDKEPNMAVKLTETGLYREHFDPESTMRIIRLMRAMPHGVYRMSKSIEGLVETSTNFAAVETQKTGTKTMVRVLTSQRSSVISPLDDITSRVQSVIELAGGVVRLFSRYPAWTPDPGSSLLTKCREVYREYTGEKAKHTAIHAGLECGVIGDKIPGMEMISMGPDIEGAHTPREKIRISSVEKLWGFICELLKKI
ncbi:MAG: aminoacyl-histidine dipeptidase [Spirochaetia bacterium]